MAIISMSYCLLPGINQGNKQHKITSIPKSSISFSSESSKPSSEKEQNTKKKNAEKSLVTLQVLNGVSELGKRLQENLSPKQKGDWKDVLLMSLSFGVYVYISQKIVCAYCVWMSMLKSPW